jgi:hypothetical protein
MIDGDLPAHYDVMTSCPLGLDALIKKALTNIRFLVFNTKGMDNEEDRT